MAAPSLSLSRGLIVGCINEDMPRDGTLSVPGPLLQKSHPLQPGAVLPSGPVLSMGKSELLYGPYRCLGHQCCAMEPI